VHPDGTITREGGYSRMLKEGECVNMDGEIESGNPENKSKDKDSKYWDDPIKSKKSDKNGDLNKNGTMDKNGNMNKGGMDKSGTDKNNTDKNDNLNKGDNTTPDRSKSTDSDVEPK
jgi:hypothetical protein